jgi:Sap, sulfolipid-1-addressing protein
MALHAAGTTVDDIAETGERSGVDLPILPLAITMMAGPQILSAIVFVTVDNAIRVSLAFLLGVLIATLVGVAVASTIANLVGSAVPLGSPDDPGSRGSGIQIVLVGLLLLASIRSYLGRETAKPPKWLGTLLSADPRRALATGLLVILLMPSDIVIMLTVGFHLRHRDAPLTAALPFVGMTVLIAALPLLGYLLFHRRAARVMPQVRDWMTTHSWLVNIVVYLIFIAIIVSGA